MPNYQGNPKIKEYGKSTRFGTENNCPYKAQQKASPPWSIRRAMRLLASMTVLEFNELRGDLDNLSNAEAIAVKKLYKAMNGDTQAMQQVTDDIDGKLLSRGVQQNTRSLADLIASYARR